MMKYRMWLMVAALGACNPMVVSPAGDAALDAEAKSPDAAPDAPACLAAGVACRGTALRCCTGYCDYQPYGYSAGSGRCVAFVGEGEYCEESRRCASGRCVDEICRAATCAATDARCDSDGQCCAGFCTASAMSYAPGRCATAQPERAACDGARWCLSGRCVEGVCAR